MAGGKAIGSLTIYSKEPDSFAGDEEKLLAELANDLSYGITAIRLREALRESEERFHAIAANTPDHILMQDNNLRYQLVINPQIGLTETDMLGKTDSDILELRDADRLTAIKRKVLETGEAVSLETSLINSRGEDEYFEGAYVPKSGPDGKTDGIIGYFRNVTKRKAAEDQLAKQAAQLQERKAQLEEINSELESFSYSISHDLRAPLRAIDGFSRIILRQMGDKFDEKTRHQFNLIRNNIKLMGVLIEDLLSFSRVQKTSINISVIDMDKLAREVWDEIREAYKERKLNFKIKKMPPGYGDHTLIRQVLFNLFSNAVKFTKNKKQGVIEMSSYKDTGKTVYCIKDNGAGFDMAHYDKLFGVFQRLHSSEEYEGTGIGLAIVQRIVSRHGGRVWADGEVDKGATFFFTLNSIPVDDVPECHRKRRNS
jgi:PAS domain S-box-containing protein